MEREWTVHPCHLHHKANRSANESMKRVESWEQPNNLKNMIIAHLLCTNVRGLQEVSPIDCWLFFILFLHTNDTPPTRLSWKSSVPIYVVCDLLLYFLVLCELMHCTLNFLFGQCLFWQDLRVLHGKRFHANWIQWNR